MSGLFDERVGDGAYTSCMAHFKAPSITAVVLTAIAIVMLMGVTVAFLMWERS